MLSLEMQTRIRELAAAQWSYRRIARHLGISRETVRAIATGERPVRRSRAVPPQERNKYRRTVAIVPPYECPGCGQKVIYQPCQICPVEAAIREGRILQRPDPQDDPDVALRLSLEVAEAAEKVRQEGFVNSHGTVFPPWSEGETERRAAATG